MTEDQSKTVSPEWTGVDARRLMDVELSRSKFCAYIPFSSLDRLTLFMRFCANALSSPQLSVCRCRLPLPGIIMTIETVLLVRPKYTNILKCVSKVFGFDIDRS